MIWKNSGPFSFNTYKNHSDSLFFYALLPGDSDSSLGKATRYGLDGPGVESLPIPVAARSKA
jgi:hypothetical protein